MASAHQAACRHQRFARLGSKVPGLANWAANLPISKKLAGLHPDRKAPQFADRTLEQWWAGRPESGGNAKALLFGDTFTNYYGPEVGIAAVEVLEAAGIAVAPAGNGCCGRPLISKGLLAQAQQRAAENAVKLFPAAQSGAKFLFCEPSCLSAVKEDAPSLLKGELREKAEVVARASVLWEEFLEAECKAGRAKLELRQGPPAILVHGHCHQKAMGLVSPMVSLLGRVPESKVLDADAGCCGMAGSFGYAEEHFEVSKKIAGRRLVPAIEKRPEGAVVVAPGFSCRHQVAPS